MKIFGFCRSLLLTAFTVAVIGALIAADWYLRHSRVRKARVFLKEEGVAIDSAGAVAAAGEGRIFNLEQLETAGVDLGEPGPGGMTPLISAIRADQAESVDFLLVRDSVIEHIEVKAPDNGDKALATTIRRGDFGLAERLVTLGAAPDIDEKPGLPMLLEAARRDDLATFEFLLNAGADPNLPGPDGLTALADGIEKQNGERVHRLLSSGADPEAKGPSGEPVLMEAVQMGDDDLAYTLLQSGAEPDVASASGLTPLIVAIQAADIQMVEVLLDHGADPNLAGKKGLQPLKFATEAQDVASMQLLIGAGADARAPGLVLEAFNNRDLPGLRTLLRSGADPEAFDENGLRVLDLAVADGALETTRALCEAGADASGKLWSALRSGLDDNVELVLTFGASVKEIDRLGGNPLDFALREGRQRTAELLLKHGADPNLNRDGKESWLASAIREGDEHLVTVLLDNGASIEGQKCSDGHSMLGWAIANRQRAVVDRLIELGADVNGHEKTPASISFKECYDHSKTFQYHLKVDSRLTPLMLAAAHKDLDIAKALAAKGANPKAYTRKYLWPVNIAAWYGDVPMQQLMLGRDPDLKVQPRKIIINLSKQRATLYKFGKPSYSTRVSTGKSGYRTKTGQFVISDKHRHHTSTIYGSSMPYFMRLSCDAFGLHEGYVPSYPASHGCIRVPHSGAKSLFYSCEVGDLVEIRY